MTQTAYESVKALERGLQILECVAQHGWIKPRTISTEIGMDRSSVYRLTNTLVKAGYIVWRKEDGAFSLTPKLIDLADGIRSDDLLSQIAQLHMQALTEKIKWPSDFVAIAGGELRILASTHHISPMTTQRALLGKTRPWLRSALGLSILSTYSSKKVRQLISAARQFDPTVRISNFGALQKRLNIIRDTGYASCVAGMEAQVSAIALPVRIFGAAAASLNIVFFRSSMTPPQAAALYLDALSNTVSAIEVDYEKHHRMNKTSRKINKERLEKRNNNPVISI